MWQILYPKWSCTTSRVRKIPVHLAFFINVWVNLLLAFGSMETDKYGLSKAELISCDDFSGKNFSEICERLASSRACALVFCKSTWCHTDRQTNNQKRNGYEFSSWCCQLAGNWIFSLWTMCSSINWLAYGSGYNLVNKKIFFMFPFYLLILKSYHVDHVERY